MTLLRPRMARSDDYAAFVAFWSRPSLRTTGSTARSRPPWALSMPGPAPQLVRPALGNAAEFMADAWQRTAADSIDVRAFSVIN